MSTDPEGGGGDINITSNSFICSVNIKFKKRHFKLSVFVSSLSSECTK